MSPFAFLMLHVEHGDCVDLSQGYKCNCWIGQRRDRYVGYNSHKQKPNKSVIWLCLVNIDEWLSTTCVNGNCSNQENGFTRSCKPGWRGVSCNGNTIFLTLRIARLRNRQPTFFITIFLKTPKVQKFFNKL